MAKRTRKNKGFIIVSILLIISFIISVILNLSLGNSLKSKKEEYLSLKEEYDKEYKIYTSNNSKLEEIKEEKKLVSNISNKIIELKEEYFKNIKILEDNIISHKTDKKIAYLTFDDGPYYLTHKYLDVLDKYDVKATFFTIGLGKEKCLDNRSYNCHLLYNEIAKRGHTIANHTFSHLIWNGLYTSADSFIEQVKKQEELIFDNTGIKTNIVRFPGGSKTAGSKKDAIVEKLKGIGYGWVDWTAFDGDGAELKTKEEAWNNFVTSIDENIEVVLFHDYNAITLEILPKAIEYLQNNGYTLLPLFYESNMINK